MIVYRLTCFLSDGGKGLWEIGQESNLQTIEREYLQENGFVPSDIQIWNDIILARLNESRTDKQSFFTWEELQEIPEKRRDDCFRTFVFCFEKQNKKLWFHSDVYDQLFEGSQETPYTLFQGLKNVCYKEV